MSGVLEQHLADLRAKGDHHTAQALEMLLNREAARALPIGTNGVLPEGMAAIAHHWEVLVGNLGEALFGSTDYPESERSLDWLSAVGHVQPPGFLWLKDAEVNAVALVPEEDAEAWLALLNYDLRTALQESAPEATRMAEEGEGPTLQRGEWSLSATCRQDGEAWRLEVLTVDSQAGPPAVDLVLHTDVRPDMARVGGLLKVLLAR